MAAFSTDTRSFAKAAEPGIFTPSIPAVWGDFYWGGSDWQ
jgi:hypothetical protein